MYGFGVALWHSLLWRHLWPSDCHHNPLSNRGLSTERGRRRQSRYLLTGSRLARSRPTGQSLRVSPNISSVPHNIVHSQPALHHHHRHRHHRRCCCPSPLSHTHSPSAAHSHTLSRSAPLLTHLLSLTCSPVVHITNQATNSVSHCLYVSVCGTSGDFNTAVGSYPRQREAEGEAPTVHNGDFKACCPPSLPPPDSLHRLACWQTCHSPSLARTL